MLPAQVLLGRLMIITLTQIFVETFNFEALYYLQKAGSVLSPFLRLCPRQNLCKFL